MEHTPLLSTQSKIKEEREQSDEDERMRKEWKFAKVIERSRGIYVYFYVLKKPHVYEMKVVAALGLWRTQHCVELQSIGVSVAKNYL